MFKITLSLTNKQGEKGRSAPFLVYGLARAVQLCYFRIDHLNVLSGHSLRRSTKPILN